MPTIDQLAPATAASDTDELLVSQSGIARKVTRAQVLAGVQPQLAISSGTLLGRSSGGTGSPEQIIVGANLSLINGRLSANATPFNVASLPAGTVPAGGDLVPLGQAGSNTAVSLQSVHERPGGQLRTWTSAQLLVTPTGAKSPTRLGDLAANTLSLTGGTLTGALTLAADPSMSQQAATKRYVDAQVATAVTRRQAAYLSGALTLAADPTTSLQAATKQYVDGQVATAVPRSWRHTHRRSDVGGRSRRTSLQAATKQYADTRVLAQRRHTHWGADTRCGSDGIRCRQRRKDMSIRSRRRYGADMPNRTLAGGDQGRRRRRDCPRRAARSPASSLWRLTPRCRCRQPPSTMSMRRRLYRCQSAAAPSRVHWRCLQSEPQRSLQAATKQYVDGQVASAFAHSRWHAYRVR